MPRTVESRNDAWFEAANAGNLEHIKKGSKKVDINAAESGSGLTAVMLAAYQGHSEVVGELVGDGKIDIAMCDADGNSALHHACYASAPEKENTCLELVLSSVLVSKQGYGGKAVEWFKKKMVRVGETSRERSMKECLDILTKTNNGRLSPAMVLASRDDAAGLRKLFKILNTSGMLGSVPDIRDQREPGQEPNRNALMLAAVNGATNAIRVLLEEGAPRMEKSFEKGADDATALLAAVRALDDEQQLIAVIDAMLSVGARDERLHLLNEPDANGCTPLIVAIQRKLTDTAKKLIEDGASRNARTKNKLESALHAALVSKQMPIVQQLLQESSGHEAVNVELTQSDGTNAIRKRLG